MLNIPGLIIYTILGLCVFTTFQSWGNNMIISMFGGVATSFVLWYQNDYKPRNESENLP